MAFSLLYNLYKYLKNKSERKITLAVLGLDNAGKTSILKQLKGEDPATASPTFGFEKQMLEEGKYTVEVFDLGGGKNIRRIWKTYLSEVHGIIYVLDASDPKRFEESRKALADSLAQAHLQGKAVLVLANKQDLPSAATAAEAAEALGLAAASSTLCCFNILGCSALKPDPRLREGIKWLVGQVHQTFPALDARVQREADVVRQEEARKKKEREEQARQMREERMRKQQEEAAAALALTPVVSAAAIVTTTTTTAAANELTSSQRDKSGAGGGEGGGGVQRKLGGKEKEMLLPNQIESPNRSYPSTVALGEAVASPAYDGSPVKPVTSLAALPSSSGPSAASNSAILGPGGRSSFSNLQDSTVASGRGGGSIGDTSGRGGNVNVSARRKAVSPTDLMRDDPSQQERVASAASVSSQRPPRPPSATPHLRSQDSDLHRTGGAAPASTEADISETNGSGCHAAVPASDAGGLLGRMGSGISGQSPSKASPLTEMVGRVSSRSNKIAPEMDPNLSPS